MADRRAFLLTAAAPLLLAGCGFALRQPPRFAFSTIYLAMPVTSLHGELVRRLEATGQVRVIAAAEQRIDADVVLESAGEQRGRVVVSTTAAGQVRELTLRLRFEFRVVTPGGRELLPKSEIAREIDQSYSESEALSKEQEAHMLYDDMQGDIVQQLMRQLATIRL